MFIPAHPGELLNEFYVRPSGISITDLATRLHTTRSTLSSLLNGRRAMSPIMALKISKAFPQSNADFWMRVQAGHELAIARIEYRGKEIKPVA